MSEERFRVVIVGGGFAGLHAARALRRAPVEVTLLDRQNHHLFQPLLYQVATGGLSPANIAAPLRAVLRRQRNATVLQAEVAGFDLPGKRVLLADGEQPYDWLIVAAGATHSYFQHDEWATLAPGLKTIGDATKIRARVLSAFERAERSDDPHELRKLMTFVIVGGGPTGVELAGALAELSRHTLRHDFRRIRPEDAKILLVDAGDRVLGSYDQRLSNKAERSLARLGVTVMTGRRVMAIEPGAVAVTVGDTTETIPTETVLWAAGVQASPLGKKLAEAAGIEPDHVGRVPVGEDLTLAGHPDVFVVGDMARCNDPQGAPLPGVAPVAIQQGEYAARTIRDTISGKKRAPFRYRDYGSMATIGRSAAVAEMGGWKFSGYFAWLLWLFVHLMQLVRFENRVLVFLQWMWRYVTHGRSARLITECEPPESDLPEAAHGRIETG